MFSCILKNFYVVFIVSKFVSKFVSKLTIALGRLNVIQTNKPSAPYSDSERPTVFMLNHMTHFGAPTFPKNAAITKSIILQHNTCRYEAHL